MNIGMGKFLHGPFNAETVERAFRRTVAEVGGGWDIQHRPDGTHETITERGRTTPLGEWIAVPYNSANFTADGGTWGVSSEDQQTLAYTLIGKTITIVFSIRDTDLSGASTTLRIAIPDGYVAAKTTFNACFVINASAPELGLVSVSATGQTLHIETITSGTFAMTTADDTNVQGQITFEIQ